MSEVLNLTDIKGYARLYKTLLEKSVLPKQRLEATIYDWYKGNIVEYNSVGGKQLTAISKDDFWTKLNQTDAKPYKTDIQLVKAIRLVMWNISLADEYADALDAVNALNTVFAQEFHQRTGYVYTDSATDYSACEDTLNPTKEPESDFDFMGVVRKNNDGPKFVYICAPLRGDVLSNIQFASDKAREVFEAGDIPVCPHLLFPPIADVEDSREDENAIKMCFKLIERCDEVRVFGGVVSVGMKQEIDHADKLRIPVFCEREKKQEKQSKSKHDPCR